jgi:hypothetical protein
VNCVDEEVVSTRSRLELTFARAWEHLRMRHNLKDLLDQSAPSEEFVAQLLQKTLLTETVYVSKVNFFLLLFFFFFCFPFCSF